ncbi:hypothetical protein ASL83_003440 [Vibrio parahaemolyticus]|nr:hypothetical protein [Vibrio parahaemolyticus]EJO2026035.1 hypothetical protein [Vibrio parahaemolyticus]
MRNSTNLTDLNTYLTTQVQDINTALSPYRGYESSTDELIDNLKQFIPTTILAKLSYDDPKSESLMLEPSMWRDLVWDFKLKIRNSVALSEISVLPFHGIKEDRAKGTSIVSVCYVDDTFTSVEATERFRDGSVITTYFSNLHSAATQTFERGYRKCTEMDKYGKLESEYEDVCPHTITSYEFRGDAIRIPSECNLEMFWKMLFRELSIEKRQSEMPAIESQRQFVAQVQSRLFKHGIYSYQDVVMPVRHWLFIFSQLTSTEAEDI